MAHLGATVVVIVDIFVVAAVIIVVVFVVAVLVLNFVVAPA